MKSSRILSASVALIALAPAMPAFAQDSASAPAAGDGQGLQDIIVTAQRREENLQKAALAVSAVAGDALVKQSITQATDLTRVVPSLQVAPAAAFTQIYLRGVGTFGSNAFAEQGVAFNLDGVYLSRPAAPAGLFYDLERIEVLKGPQGTLYGRNASGGALNVITAKPQLGVLGGNATAEYGNYNAVKASGAVNVPIGDNAAFRFSGQYAKHDGYFSDGYDDEDTKAVRGQLKFDTGGGFNALLSIDYADVGGKGPGGTIMPLLDGKNRLGSSDPAVLAAYYARIPTAPVPQITAKGDGYQNNHFFGASATINANLGFAELTVIPAYRKTDLDFLSYTSGFKIADRENSDQMSIETRLANKSGPLNWVVGAYYFVEDVLARQRYDQGSNGTVINSRLHTRSVAAFGQLTYSLTDTFRLTGGLRYTSDNKQQVTEAHTLPFVGFVPNVFPLVPIIADIVSYPRSNVDFNRATWKAGVEYDAGPHSLLYASVSTGFKSGILYAATGDNYSRPELITAYTIGSKNRFLENKLQLNIEAFYWDYKDQQISHLAPAQVAATPAGPIYGPIYVTENAGAATIYGAEAELLFQPTHDDLFSANLQYLHSKYDTLNYQFYSVTGVAPVVGCPATVTALTGATPAAKIYNVNCSGRPLVNAPRWALNAAYEHTFDMGKSGKIRVGADTRVESSRYLSIDFVEVGRQKGYMMSNAHISYETASGAFSLTGFVSNIEDKLVFSNTNQSPAKAGTFYNQLRPPRTYGIRAGVKF
ncbi:TonB-dependent receptor [Sphingomonas sp. MMSM20]|uniref:TonB-dependent receptor n=1 Tax=Sphingomonas lycopersici TaxID=2951807 RepID=UPI002237917F|nr:TonB-dependent receptor [Sphingomonas lycopersici]MCW6528621.1 TonB-dependent receptor [Sphingomonas lycopersici]